MGLGHQAGLAHSRRPLIVIESPYAGSPVQVELNVELAERACRFCVLMGGNPYASHLFFTRFLDDSSADERAAGIECGLAWVKIADEIWFILRDNGVMSTGMRYALAGHVSRGKRLRFFRTADNGRSFTEVEPFPEAYEETDEETKALIRKLNQPEAPTHQPAIEETIEAESQSGQEPDDSYAPDTGDSVV